MSRFERGPLRQWMTFSIFIPAMLFLAACGGPVEKQTPLGCDSDQIPAVIFKDLETGLFKIQSPNGLMPAENPLVALEGIFGPCDFTVNPDPNSSGFRVEVGSY